MHEHLMKVAVRDHYADVLIDDQVLFEFRELGKTKTAIDLGCSGLTPEQLSELEEECNEAIRNHTNVTVHVYESAKDPELQQVSEVMTKDSTTAFPARSFHN